MRMIKSYNLSNCLLITLLFLLGCSSVPHSTNYKSTSEQLSANEIKSNQPITKRNIGSISEIILKKAISEYRNQPWSGVSMNRWSGTIKIPTGTLHRIYEDQNGVYFQSPNGKYVANSPVGIFVPFNDQDSPVPFVYHMTLNATGYEIGDTPAEVQFTSESANNQVIDSSKVKKDDQVRVSQTNDAINKVLSESLESNRKHAHKQSLENSSKFNLIVNNSDPDASGIVTINIQTNTDTSSLKINGEELGRKYDGSYSVKKVVRVGQETKFNIVGIDVNGNADSKTIAVFRQAAESKVVFGQLNAANVKQQPARDAVAIIIGIEKYKRVAKADFANADAQVFYDYASRALGVKPENIKLLVDDGADDAEIYRAFQNWLPLKVKKGKTEVFVFFSGHGLPSQDGKSLYLLPWGVDKDFIEKTAINQQEIIASLQAVQPKSVTMFLDSCYSGQARGGETLLASARPIALKAEANAYPTNFTVISASAPDQLSSSSPDLKHGIFSYYLMKGMEGDADQNKDGKITVAEIQEYLTDMVGRQAMGMNRKQQPQLFGDADRVLVGR